MSLLIHLEGGPLDGASGNLPEGAQAHQMIAVRMCVGPCQITYRHGFHAREHWESRAQHNDASIYVLVEVGPLEAFYRWRELRIVDPFQRICEALDLEQAA